MKRVFVVAVEYGGNFTGTKLYLSRSILNNLLFNLDQKKAGMEAVFRAVIKEAHPKKTPKSAEVFALENEDYYSHGRFPGDVHPDDEPGQG